MSQQTPVLYGDRLYSRTTYSTNADPETFNLVLGETVGSTDALLSNATKSLTELISFLETFTTSGTKPLSDTATVTDTFAKLVTRLLADTTTVADSVAKTVTKPLSEAPIPLEFVLYGAKLYGRTAYSANFDVTNPSVHVDDTTLIKYVTKLLSETTTLSDAQLIYVTKAFSELVETIDSQVVLNLTVALNDILLLQDWISIRLSKPQLWNVQTTVVVPDSLYSYILFGRNVYSGLNTQKWIVNQPNSRRGNWRSFNELGY